MRTSLLILVFLSHGAASLGFWRAVIRCALPSTVDFASISVILYCDVALIVELLTEPYDTRYLSSLLNTNDRVFGISVAILALLPWLFRLGSLLCQHGEPRLDQTPRTSLSGKLRLLFYVMITGLCLILTVTGLLRLTSGEPIWETRTKVAADWGTMIVVLYLPLHVLAFYVRQVDSRDKRGFAFTLLLVTSSIVSTLAIAQRTHALLPFVIVGFFWRRPTVKVVIGGLLVLVVVASVLLPAFKYSFSGTDRSSVDLIAHTIQNDFSRSSSLASVVTQSLPLGSQILPYPLAGYAYSILFFVPRQVAWFKGQATATYLTSSLAGSDPDETNWALGIGAPEEALLNAGFIPLAPILIIYGLLLGFLDKWSARFSSLVVPTRLAGLWLCGYNLPALLLIFGTMVLVAWSLEVVFVRPSNLLFSERPGLPQVCTEIERY